MLFTIFPKILKINWGLCYHNTMKESAAEKFLKHFKPGKVYRMKELTRVNSNASHHVRALLKTGELQRVSAGKYLRLKKWKYGTLPPEPEELVSAFLNKQDFLLVNENNYSSINPAFTQLSMTPKVVNRSRSGVFEIFGQFFLFERREDFPKKMSWEYFLVQYLDSRVMDEKERDVKEHFRTAKLEYDSRKLLQMARKYGKLSTRNFLEEFLNEVSV